MLYKTVLTVGEVAAVLSCSQYKVYQLLNQQILQGYHDANGRMWKIPETAVKDYMNRQMNCSKHQ